MATHTFAGPSGTRYEFDAPDGATPEEINAYAKHLIDNKLLPGVKRAPAGTRLWEGGKMGLGDYPVGATQLTANLLGLIPSQTTRSVADAANAGVTKRERDYVAGVRGEETDVDWGRTLGQLPGSAMIFSKVPGVGKADGGAVRMAKATGAAGAAGGLSGLLSPTPLAEGESYWGAKGRQVAGNAAAGGAAGLLFDRVAAGMNPVVSKAVKVLREKGVQPTVGQLLGPKASAAEEKIASVPLVGSAIKIGRDRAMRQWNKAMVQDALTAAKAGLPNPASAAIPKGTPAGTQALAYADDVIGQGYDALLKGTRSFPTDPQLTRAIAQLEAGLPPAVRPRFGELFTRNVISNLDSAGRIPAERYKLAEKSYRLAEEAAKRNTTLLGEADDLAFALRRAREELQDWMGRQTGKQSELAALNRGYAILKRAMDAAGSAGVKDDGLFTPAQYYAAARGASKKVSTNAWSTGRGMRQGEADAAAQVLGLRVPNSGTADRAMAAGALGGIPAAMLTGNLSVNPATVLGAGAGLAATVPYTPWGQAAAGTLLAGQRPAAVRAAGQGLRYATGPAASLLYQLADDGEAAP